jgi:hypothetical protein
MTLKLEIISFIAIVNREFSLSNDLTGKLEYIVESRYRELDNNQFTDFKTVKIAEIVLGSLLYLDSSIKPEKFINRLYPNENEANQMLFSINRYPEWLQRKGVTVKAVEKSRVLQMIGVKQ